MSGPLAGVRVLELGTAGPGPWSCMVLAGMGASVLRVERPDADVHAFPGKSVLARSRTSVQLDLKNAEDRARVLALVEHADVLIEGFRAGVTERLGLGPSDCHARNPRLVYGRMTGWGQSGPSASLAGHDLNYLAATGALASMVERDRAPSYPLSAALTFGGGSMFLVSGVVAALYEREQSGAGQVVDAAIADGISMLLASSYGLLGKAGPALAPTPSDSTAPYYGTYRCADGKWIAIAAFENRLWRTLIEVLGLPEPEARDDPEHWPQLRAELTEIFAGRTRQQWVDAFEGVDAAFSPVLELAEVPDSAQAQARETFVRLGDRVQPSTAPKFSRTQSSAPTSAAPSSTAWTSELLTAAGFADPSGPFIEEASV